MQRQKLHGGLVAVRFVKIGELHQLVLEGNAGRLQRLAIAGEAVGHRRNGERTRDIADATVAEIGQVGDCIEDGATVVEDDGVRVDALADAVDQHDWHIGAFDESS